MNNDLIKKVVSEFFSFENEMVILLKTHLVKRATKLLLAKDMIDKMNLDLDDLLTITLYKRESEFAKKVMDITDKDLEKENNND